VLCSGDTPNWCIGGNDDNRGKGFRNGGGTGTGENKKKNSLAATKVKKTICIGIKGLKKKKIELKKPLLSTSSAKLAEILLPKGRMKIRTRGS